jgi:hypothetical protein
MDSLYGIKERKWVNLKIKIEIFISEERKTKTLEILINMLKEDVSWNYWSKEGFMNEAMLVAMDNLKQLNLINKGCSQVINYWIDSKQKVFSEARLFKYKLRISNKRALKEILIDKVGNYIKFRKSWNQGNSLICPGKKLVRIDFNYKERCLDEIVPPEVKWNLLKGKLFEKHPYEQGSFRLVARYESSSLVVSRVFPKRRTINWIILFFQFCKNWNIILVEEADPNKLHKDLLMGIDYFSFQNYKPGICCSDVQWENERIFDILSLMFGLKVELVG